MYPTQERILKLFINQSEIHRNYRQIGRAIGEQYPQTVKHHINQLVAKGLLKEDKRSKTLKIIRTGQIENTDLVNIPIVGSANCGEAKTYAEEHLEGFLKLSKKFLHGYKELIAVRANGDSMNRAKVNGSRAIENGDYVIIDCNNKSPQDGDYVLSIIDGLANIKKFRKDVTNNQIVLISESTVDYPPIFVDPENYNYLINGKVVNVLKNR